MALTYDNGYVPRSIQTVFRTGFDAQGRYYEWRLPHATYKRHLALVARALARTGRTLSPSSGWSCDRPYAEQVYARNIHGVWAAVPGKSSHGGNWAGPITGWKTVDTAAIDYGNWAWVYEKFGSRAREEFYADCRAVGLTPGAISEPAFPDEPWHVIDLNPYATTGAPAGQEEEDMPLSEDDIERVARKVWSWDSTYGKHNMATIIRKLYYSLLPGEAGVKHHGLVYKLQLQIKAQGAANEAAIRSLAAAKGVDPEAVLAAVRAEVKDALAGAELSITLDSD